MKAMVLGTGAVGSVIAEILGHSEEFDKVVLADVNLERARRAEKKVSADKVTVQRVDASDTDSMVTAFREFDIVLNAVIPRFNMNIMAACLASKTNYVDMAWDVALDKTRPGEVIRETPAMHFLKLDAEYKNAGLTGMMGLGCDPGLSNLFARMGSDRMDRVSQILVRDGDNGAVAGHHFAPLWSPETLIEEVLMPATYYADGHYRKLPPFSGKEHFHFPDPLGTLPIYNVDHEEAETLPTYIGEVLGKLSHGFERYLSVLSLMSGEHLNLFRQISDGEIFHLENAARSFERSAELKLLHDRFLDLYSSYLRGKSPQTKQALVEAAGEIRSIDPRFNFDVEERERVSSP